MKKTKAITLSLLLLTMTACANGCATQTQPAQTATPTKETENSTAEPTDTKENSITLKSPLVLASTDIGTLEYVDVVMKNGTYAYDHMNYQGEYKGEFYLQHYKEEELINETKLEPFVDNEVIFKDSFPLYAEDYNGDGNVDFLVGERLNENVGYYQMYTLTEENTFEQLDVGTEENYLCISGGNGSYELEKKGKNTWKYDLYDQEKGWQEITIQWNGSAFEEKEREVVSE